jgi:hypothetical protein
MLAGVGGFQGLQEAERVGRSMSEQDQTPRQDDDAMGHIRRKDDDARSDDDAMGHIRRKDDDARGDDDDDDTTGHIRKR